MCERCGKPGYIVHHKILLTEFNINNPEVTLNHDNLEYLCLDCHNKEHDTKANLRVNQRRKYLRPGFKFNEDGELVKMDIFIVWGSPASGKTTFVRQNMETGDLVIDLDLIKQALSFGDTDVSKGILDIAIGVRDYLYRRIEEKKVECDNVWIIATLPKRKEREELSERFGAELIYMDVSKNECIQRAYRDDKRKNKEMQARIINRWFEQFEE